MSAEGGEARRSLSRRCDVCLIGWAATDDLLSYSVVVLQDSHGDTREVYVDRKLMPGCIVLENRLQHSLMIDPSWISQ
jgi:hypothetical protein